MGDHSVQAAFLGHWSFTKDRHRRGRVYAFKEGTPSKGWFPVGIENILAEKNGDKLSPGEVTQLNKAANDIRQSPAFQEWAKYPQMEVQRLLDLPSKPIHEGSLEEDLIQPLESNGYSALCEAADDPVDIKQRLNFEYLAKWVLLHWHRTKKGKDHLAQRIKRGCGEVLGGVVTDEEFNQLLANEGCGLNYLFYSDYLHGNYNQARSKTLQDMYSRAWTVREVDCQLDVICSDNPIVNVGNYPQSIIVPLGPRRVLFIHVKGPGVGPQPLDDYRVRTINGIQRMNAQRWLISNVQNPSVPTEKEMEEEQNMLERRIY